ncbi:MAG: bifunctional riboflavin kinase/FAD synthetase [Bacteroidetes bacterium]|nr:bifunctional riboflavin kinase/FAD synthetase [Bacteroidota bacterium]
MQVYTQIADFKKLPNAIVTQGTFDGVHAGHKKILSRLSERALALKGESVVLTFFPHPRMVLFPNDENIKLINTLEENIKLLSETGIQHLIVLEFTPAIASLTALQLVRDILVNAIGTRHFIIGYDHRFGHNRAGSYENLKEFSQIYDFTLEKVGEVEINDITVSSTKIRRALLQGDIETATDYLQHRFTLRGIVTEGNKLGRTLGFPTANFLIQEKYKIIPADGVYAVQVIINEMQYGGMLNIGNRPTIGGLTRVLEVNIFNFEADIYGELIEVAFIKRIRHEQKFASIEELQKQLFMDRNTVNELLISRG